MTFWELAAAVDGYLAAHVGPNQTPSEDDREEMIAFLEKYKNGH